MFELSSLQLNRGTYNSQFGNAPCWHSYVSTLDDLSTVLSPGYFPNFFDSPVDRAKVNDIIYITASDTQYIGLISSLAPIIINLYHTNGGNSISQSFVMQDVTWSGPWDHTTTRTNEYIITGDSVQILLAGTSGVTTSGTTITLDTLMPFNFPTPILQPVLIQNNSVDEMGRLSIFGSGNARITRLNGAAFTGPGNATFYSCSIVMRIIT